MQSRKGLVGGFVHNSIDRIMKYIKSKITNSGIYYLSLILNYCLILFLIVINSNHLSAQNFKTDLEKMNGNYSQVENFYAEINIQLYQRAKDKTPQHTKNAVLRKSGTHYLYDLDNVTMLINNKCMLMINADRKTITYNNIKKAKKQKIGDVVMPELDSLLKRYDKVEYKGMIGDTKKYVIYIKNTPINKIEIYLDKRYLWLRKLVYYYNQEIYDIDSKAEITFKRITDRPNFENQLFSEKNYVRKSKGEWSPTPKYKSYKVFVTE